MSIPPVFCVDELPATLLDDLRDACTRYGQYAYTTAFDDLMLMPGRRAALDGFLRGDVSPLETAQSLRQWLLKPWSSTRSLTASRMKAVGLAMASIRRPVAAMVPELSLHDATPRILAQMAGVFRSLDDCAGVGSTIASKLLAALRPALFPMWDIPIAEAYGFALNAAGYRQFLNVTQAIARKACALWNFEGCLEGYLRRADRIWTPPLAKVLDEWNWIRITRGHQYEEPQGRTV